MQRRRLGEKGFTAYADGDLILAQYVGFSSGSSDEATIHERTFVEATGIGQTVDERVTQLTAELKCLPRACAIHATRFPSGVITQWIDAPTDRILIPASLRAHYLWKRVGEGLDPGWFEQEFIRTLLDPDVITRTARRDDNAIFYRASERGLTIRIPIVVPTGPGRFNAPRTAFPVSGKRAAHLINLETVVWRRRG